MFSIIVILAFTTGALAREQFIVGGSDVDIADYPWQGSYRTSSNSHTCGCIFIGGQYALTAAHCGGVSGYSMEFGGTVRNTGTVFDVASVVLHPEYGTGPGFTPNDIALVTATGEISGTNISPATMSSNSTNPEGTGWITGWGRTCGSCALPTTLQGTEIEIIGDDACTDKLGDYFQAASMICVWDGTNGTTGACNGDSGGPMTVGNTVYGIASWVASGCLSDYPSVYARVGSFQSWVCQHAGSIPVGC